MHSLEKKVKPTIDSSLFDNSDFINAKVYYGNILDEVTFIEGQKCFGGAWYRKCASSKDYWLGIEGIVELGEFIQSEKRILEDKRVKIIRNLDNPSVYVGGKALHEADCGLGYNICYLDDNTIEEIDLDAPRIAYRPFYRYIYNEVFDDKGNVDKKSVNSWNILSPKLLQYYYFPGDVIKMQVYSPIQNYLQMRISVIKKTENPKYVEIRKKYKLKNDAPRDYLSPLFYSEGQGVLQAEFKRVNSIDQYGNEGFVAKMTDAVVTEAIWHECYLYRKINNEIVKVPFTKERQVSLICPNEDAFTISYEGINIKNGGEKITIHPIKSEK